MYSRASLCPIHPGSCLMAVLVVVLAGPVLPASAQDRDTGDGVDEIVVTARKREERAIDVPESLAVIGVEAIERTHIKGLEDVGILVPNLNLSVRADGFPNVSIRGLGSFGNTQGVGFYLDDVQIFSDASSRFGDLERIEVLKGPQGVLYGGSNIGGAVKFVSARPDPERLSGRIKVRGGEQNIIDVEGSVNVPLGDSGWAMRVFAFGYNDDGYLENPNRTRVNGLRTNNDEDIGEIEEYGVRVSLAGSITERLSAYASVRWSDLDGPNNAWVREIDDSLDHPDTVTTTFNPRHDRETFAAMLELTLEFDGFDVTSISSYTDTESVRYTDLDIREEFLLDLERPEDMKVFTQELRFTSTGDGPFQWIAGLYYSKFEEEMRSELIWFDARADAMGNFSGPLGCALGMPTCSGVWAGDTTLTLAQELDTIRTPFELRDRDKSHLAAFVNATYNWEAWEVSLGVRVDEWKNESANLDTGISSEQDDIEVLPRFSLSRSLGDDAMVYFTFAMGYEPGGFNLANFAGQNALFGFEAEDATSYELGWKGQLMDGRLTASIAAFYIDYDKRQIEFQADNNGSVIEGIVNLGDSKHKGVEGEVAFRVNEALLLSASAGYVDAEWDNGTIVLGQDLGGRTPPVVNDFSWNLAADYRQPITDALDVIAGVQVSRSGEYEGLQAWDPITNPDYTVVNAQLGVAGKQWELVVGVENLFDEEYYHDVQRFPNFYMLDGGPNIIIGTLGQPRLLTATLSYRF